MKQIVEWFERHNLMFKVCEPIDNKQIHNRTKIKLYKAIDLQSRYWLILIYPNNTKILKKEAAFFESLFEATKKILGHNFMTKLLLHKTTVCSKAKKELKQQQWEIFDDFV